MDDPALIAAEFVYRSLKECGQAQPPPPEELRQRMEVPKEYAHGNVAFPCFTLAKPMGMAPAAISKRLQEKTAAALTGHPALEKCEAAGPYLNFFLKTPFLARLVPSILDGSMLAAEAERGDRVMIEYSQPNTHKSFHVGHMRNVALGDALVRLYEFQGCRVVAANYIGDVGMHIAKCLWYLRTHFKGAAPSTGRGEFLGALYSSADEMLDFTNITALPHPGLVSAVIEKIEAHPSRRQWKVLGLSTGAAKIRVVCGGRGYSEGDVVAFAPAGEKLGGRLVEANDLAGVMSEGVACSVKELGLGEDKDLIHVFPKGTAPGVPLPELGRVAGALPEGESVIETMQRRSGEVSRMLRDIEQQEPSAHALWLETRQWSLDEFRTIYDWVGCRFDHYFHESDVGEEGKKIVLDALARGLLLRSEGAIGADLSKWNLGFFMLLKSDGTGLYSTKDIALAKKKFEDFRIDRSIYVVDHSQSLHFAQVFKTLEILGYPQAEKCRHLAYGLVMLPEGKMSSRKGNVITFSRLKESLGSHIRRNFLEKHRGEWPDAEIEEAVRRISVAAIRYGMLNQDNLKTIVFDIAQWTEPTGNTGPYLLYAYTRTRSILREVAGLPVGELRWELIGSEKERIVLSALADFRRVARRAMEENKPAVLCGYLYELSRSFSRMYEDCPVKRAESADLRATRMALVEAAGLVIRRGLSLLGIEVLERM